MIRLLLEFIAIVLAFRVVRAIIAYLFPPVDTQSRQDQSKESNSTKKAEYQDVKEAKFEDLQ